MKPKTRDRLNQYVLWLIASFLAVNNAYQLLLMDTLPKGAYYVWGVIGLACVVTGWYLLFKD